MNAKVSVICQIIERDNEVSIFVFAAVDHYVRVYVRVYVVRTYLPFQLVHTDDHQKAFTILCVAISDNSGVQILMTQMEINRCGNMLGLIKWLQS